MGGPLTPAVAWARAALLAPVSRRARNELLFCLAGVPLGLGLAGVVVWVMGVAAGAAAAPRSDQGWVVAGVAVGVLLAVVLATRVGRRLGAVHRRLAARLLGTRVPAPPPPAVAAAGAAGWLAAGLGDGPAGGPSPTRWKLPLAFLEAYAVFWWAGGLVNLTYPFWWGLFRNHPPGVTLDPVPVATPFPGRLLQVATFPAPSSPWPSAWAWCWPRPG